MEKDQEYQDAHLDLQQGQDSFSEFPAVPSGKLDADEYLAQDLDGVTESLFGSGNLNFLSLQAGQTNNSMVLNDVIGTESSELSLSNESSASGFVPTFNDSFSNKNIFGGVPQGGNSADTDRPLDTGDPSHVDSLSVEGNFSNTTIGSLGASTLSSDAHHVTFSGGGNSSGGDVVNIEGSTSTGGGDTSIINQITHNVTEVVTTLGDTTFLEQTINNVTDELTGVLGDGQIALDLDASALESLVGHTGLIVDDTIFGALDISSSNGITGLVYDLTGLSTPFVADAGALMDFDLFSGIDGAADGGDINISGLDAPGLDIPDIALDPVENIIGDINVGIGADIANPNALLGEALGGLGDLQIAGVADVLNILGGDAAEGVLNVEIFDSAFGEGFTLGVDSIQDEAAALVSDVVPVIDENALSDIVGGAVDNDLLADVGDGLGGIVDDLSGGDAGSNIQDVVDLLGGGEIDGSDGNVLSDIVGGAVDNDLLVDVGGGLGGIVDDLSGGDAGSNIQDVVDLLGGGEIDGPDEGALSDIVGDAVDNDLLADVGDGLGGIVDDLSEGDAGSNIQDVVDVVLGGGETDGSDGNALSDVVGDAVDNDLLADVGDGLGGIVDDLLEVLDSGTQDALDLLGGDGIAGAEDGTLTDAVDNLWTESVGGGSGLFDDVIVSNDSGSILPDPSEGVAEGLGALDIPHGDLSGALGGLFG